MSAGDTLVDTGRYAAAEPLLGRGVRLHDTYIVGREKIREYARAVQDFHPVHWDETAARHAGYADVVAPLTFLSLIGIQTFEMLLAEVLVDYDPSGIIQTDQILTYHRPVTVGDRLMSDSHVHSLRHAAGGDLITTKNTVFDHLGRPVLTGFTGVMARSPQASAPADSGFVDALKTVLRYDIRNRVTPPRGPADDLAAPEMSGYAQRTGLPAYAVSAGMELPPRTIELTLGDLVNYAGVSGDSNPIHWSVETARLAGLEKGVVAHGMLLMGAGAGFVTSWLGDPGAVRDYSVRMTSPVYVRHDRPGVVEFAGRVKSVDIVDRTAVIAITATHDGKKIFGRAIATVQLS
ncbi:MULTISPECIES: fused (3R)-hydroxyacyl-ACP dehydratase subunits HadA/HadB [unclassified Nocardia]|uniref:fused (3R)-hydroxyacyl-ACP dehydratase subunits HadA/HadB n=1 Tax=unclassified Nocardia TaxID=2637762 RepID=UPI001CE4ACA0|nr:MULTISPECIES: fused (3R)-hydroxyacyl-ACP dehydratase subunits HadA/HadB [unclassified Nocardia]